MTLTQSEELVLVELVLVWTRGTTLTVDALPYTQAFDRIHAAFEATQRPVSKGELWRQLIRLRKSKAHGPRLRRRPARRQR